MEKLNIKYKIVRNSFCFAFVLFIFHFSFLTSINAQTSPDWYMAGANPQRTGWVRDAAGSSLHVEWYLPIEAYIDQKVQLITTNGMVYVSTSKGLIAVDAGNGSIRWRYDTQLPLGQSPTVDTSQNPAVLYVGGLDKKLHALNANTGVRLWTFDGARAGFYTNPLVVEGKVILGNRDGGLYAVNAVGSSSAGQLAWKFQTDGPILFSPAYKSGIVYFASNDNHAYGVRANNGTQLWKSAKLPGDGFHSYYPVIYKNKVIFPTTHVDGQHIKNEFRAKQVCPPAPAQCYYEPIIPGDPLGSVDGTLIGNIENPTSWSNGYNTLYPWRVLEHFENNSDGDPYFHKPANRPFVVLDQQSGQEFTFDSEDADTAQEYIPFSFWNDEGTQYPPVVDLNDQLAYAGAPIACCSDTKGKLYGWNIDVPSRLSIVGATVNNGTIAATGGWAAMAEPQAVSGGGVNIYRNLCCDRVGDWFKTSTPSQNGEFWRYSLNTQIPGYGFLWTISPVAESRHIGWYSGNYVTGSGMYHAHGDQAPLIPYNGNVYAHRSNVIIKYGSGLSQGLKLSTVPIVTHVDDVSTPSLDDLKAKLESEVQKIVDVDGHLRPGYLANNLHNYGGNRQGFEDYFANPGDTLFTLSFAYPYLSNALKQQVADYLNNELFPDFFNTNPTVQNPTMYAKMGYSEGSAREWFDIPTELFSTFQPQQKTTNPGTWAWTYPQTNFYAMYLYAKNIPGANIDRIYRLAKNKLQVPFPANSPPVTYYSGGENQYFSEEAFEHNGWISGYHGFLLLQDLAGMSSTDAVLRNSVTTEKNRLVSLRNTLFNKETPYINLQNGTATNAKKTLDIARNFMFLTPELGSDYRNNSQLFQKAQDAMTMYEYLTPFWQIGKYEAMPGESVFQSLYPQSALFQAKAWIFQSTRQELYKYLDAPMFKRGDLFYIQNLVTTIEAPTTGPEPTNVPTSPPSVTPPPIPGDANGDTIVDGLDYVIWLNHYGDPALPNNNSVGNFNSDTVVDGLDYVIWLNNYSV